MKEDDVAIVGMAGRFPGASNLDAFWANLAEGVESIRFLSDEELIANGAKRREIEDADYVRACPVLDDIDKFDAAFFGISPREASIMDPSHRFFLEVVWEALEHSGNTGLHDEGTVAVFAASGAPYYLMDHVRSNTKLMAEVGEFLARHSANDMNFLATRASYELDLRGPSVNVQTACSSALAAIHHARVALLRQECDLALAGASTIVLPMGVGYKYKEGEILSPDGHCRPFDHRSAGTVFGSGTGCFVLKRLQDAYDAGDTIYAIVKGSAMNNDGALKVGYLAPGVERQVDVIRDALDDAKVPAETISYVETHGTGTSVGDPIELTALSEALSMGSTKKGGCGVGSVKSNIGHLGEAAACASLAKVLLAFKQKKLPPTLGFERPNPQLQLDESPLYIVDRLVDWSSEGPRRCGVTALGAGGTNVHVVLEEPGPAIEGEGGRSAHLLLLSARSRAALERQCERLADAVEHQTDLDLADAAYTLAVGRRCLEYRRAVVATTKEEAAAHLRSGDPKLLNPSVANLSSPRLAFSFPGGGAQYAGMGKGLYENDPVYREAMDECLVSIDELFSFDVRPLLFAGDEEQPEATRRLESPSLSLPALFATEYALAQMFESWGIEPDAMVGHSMGEYVAACLAGVFSVSDAIRLVAARGRLFEKTEPGSMVAVSLSEEGARALMPPGLDIAAVNAPEMCVVSGPRGGIADFKERLTAEDVDWTAVHIDVAAHSSMLEPILAEFREFCEAIQFNPPERPVVSNLTGGWLTPGQATDPGYWVQHLRSTVRFADCVETVLADGEYVFLEIGPGRTLTSLANAQRSKVSHCINSIRHVKEMADDLHYALATFGKVWGAGVKVDWTAFYEGQIRNRVPLPTYPFEPSSFFLERNRSGADNTRAELVKREDLDTWFYTPTWKPAPSPIATKTSATWLLVSDDTRWGSSLSEALTGAGARTVIVARYGKALRRVSKYEWRFDANTPSQLEEILEVLDSEGTLPEHTVFAVSLESTKSASWQGWVSRARSSIEIDPLRHSSEENEHPYRDYLALVWLARALSNACDSGELSIVTSHAFSLGNEDVRPLRRLLLGPSRVIPRELPEFVTRFIDWKPGKGGSAQEGLANELLSSSEDAVVLLRGVRRWIQTISPVKVPSLDTTDDAHVGEFGSLPRDAVIAITGGLGGIGLVVARQLAERKGARIALISRTQMPPRGEWAALLETETPSNRQLRKRLKEVAELEALGAQVICVAADVTELSSLERAARAIEQKWGEVDVLIHAAGLIDDGPFQTKSDEAIRRVLEPKVRGTNNLEHVFGAHLKLFVLFSSVSSFLGLPGQIDYSSANAYMDAVAEKRSGAASGRTVVINWNAWRDVGMVASGQESTAPLVPSGCHHPWLTSRRNLAGGFEFLLDLAPSEDWLLAEHQIRGGLALVPGTGFVELLRAAYSEYQKGSGVELRDVRFVAPFQVSSGGSRRMSISLKNEPTGTSAVVSSVNEAGEHVVAQMSGLTGAPRKPLDLAAIELRCPQEVAVRRGGFLHQDFVDFGPRWGNIESVHKGQGESLIHLKLDANFASDLPTLEFHPAVMDMATGAAQHLIPGFDGGSDFFVPFAYERIRIFAPVESECVSHVRLSPSGVGEIAVFDVTVADLSGRVLVDIEGFTMKRAKRSAEIVQAEKERAESGSRKALESLLREAICPEEGLVALERSLAQSQLGQVIVSSVDINLWLEQLADSRSEEDEDDSSIEVGFARPELGAEYVSPENPLEACLAGMWSKLLGVAQPGVQDDFFELGGDSLIAVRLFARIKKQLGVSLPISTLFGAPTIRSLAELLAGQGVEVAEGKRVEDRAVKRYVPFAEHPQRGLKAPELSPGLYRPTWRRLDALSQVSETEDVRTWLIFVDDLGLGRIIKHRLGVLGHRAVLVRPGDGYLRGSSADYVVAPEKGRGSYDALLRDLVSDGRLPTDVVHMWLTTKEESFRPGSSFFHRSQEQGCYSLLGFAQALADAEIDVPMNLTCVTNGLSQADPLAVFEVHDSKAMARGILACISTEFPRIRTRWIELEGWQNGDRTGLGRQLANTFKSATSEELMLRDLSQALLSELFLERAPKKVLLTTTGRFEQAWLPWEVRERRAEAKPVAKSSTYCLLGEPTPLVRELLDKLVNRNERTRIVWLQDVLSGDEWSAPHSAPSLFFENPEVDLIVENCDLTNLESVITSLGRYTVGESTVAGAILCCRNIKRELMQLLVPGEAEEALSEQVQSAQILTSSMRGIAPEGFVLLVGTDHGQEPLVGQATRRGGDEFLLSHANKCRRRGQRVSCLWEDHGVEQCDVAERVVEEIVSGEELGGDFWALSRRDAGKDELLVDEREVPPSLKAIPHNARLESELVELFRIASGNSSLHAHTPLSDLDVSRLKAARLFTHIKNHYRLNQTVFELMRYQSAAEFAALIDNGVEEEDEKPSFRYLVPMHPDQSKMRTPFFLVAGMFGNILNLRHLGRLLGVDRPVYGIQARGLYGDEKPHRTIEDMAAAYLEEIKKVVSDGPFLLGGFSGGGLVAFEMAKRLRAEGGNVPVLILLDTPLPQRPKITYRDRLVMQRLKLQRGGGRYVKEWAKNRLSWELELLRRRFHQIDESYDPGGFKNDAIQEAFLGAAAAYQVGTYGGKVLLYRPVLDKAYEVAPGRYINSERELVLEDQGWGPYVAEIEVREVPGDHDHMVLEPEVRVLASLMRRALAEVDSLANGRRAWPSTLPRIDSAGDGATDILR